MMTSRRSSSASDLLRIPRRLKKRAGPATAAASPRARRRDCPRPGVVEQREVLVDGLDAQLARVLGRVDADSSPSIRISPRSCADDAPQRLDQRRLAGAVVAQQGRNVAELEAESSRAHRTAPNTLGGVAHLEQRGRGLGHARDPAAPRPQPSLDPGAADVEDRGRDEDGYADHDQLAEDRDVQQVEAVGDHPQGQPPTIAPPPVPRPPKKLAPADDHRRDRGELGELARRVG